MLPRDENATFENTTTGSKAEHFGRLVDGTLTVQVVPVSGEPSGVLLELADGDFNKIEGVTGTDSLTYTITEPGEYSVWVTPTKNVPGETFKLEAVWEASYTSSSSDLMVIDEPIQSSCSSSDGVAMTLSVTNNTADPVSLIWIDRACAEVAYQTIESGQSVQQSTFEGHDWLVRSANNAIIQQIVASASNPNIVIGSPSTANNAGTEVSTSQCSVPTTSVQELIDAINRANDEAQCPGADTIFIVNPLSTMAGYNDGDTAFPAITSSITIDGTPQSDDGFIPNISRPADAPQFRFFVVDGTNGNLGDLTLKNIILEGGYALDGGAVFVDASNGGTASITADGVSFLQNIADGNGGAVMTFSLNGGQVTADFTNSNFGNNTGSFGGAFYSGGFDGGNATATIKDTIFTNNTASRDGGAIYNNGLGANGLAVMTLDQGVTFTNNTAQNGGAVISNGSNGGNASLITLFNLAGLLTDNSANNAGDAIFLVGQGGNATFGGQNQPIGGAENICITDDTGTIEFETCP